MTMDMLAHFGFRKTPFTLELSPEEHLDLPHFDSALVRMTKVVEKRLCATITAVPGTGKTSLIRLLDHRLPEARYRVHYVKVTSLSKRDFCREIAAVCGIAPVGTYPNLVRKLQQHWETSSAVDGLRTILILDEAHDIRPEVLAILRILTNFEMDSRLVISIILAGQPPLKAMLGRDELEDVAKRIATYVDLRLLSRDETLLYIEHRCLIAGAATTHFDTAALEAIYEMSRGNMRAIDRLALEALEIAAEAKAGVVSSGHVVAAKRNLWP
jgi:type II secretory pathway predicted ATPase ExeA